MTRFLNDLILHISYFNHHDHFIDADFYQIGMQNKSHGHPKRKKDSLRSHSKDWWDGGALRYDYKYSKDELETWRIKLKKLEEKKKVNKVYMFFNNCHAGHAVANALGMSKMIII